MHTFKPSQQRTEAGFSILLCTIFTSLFLGSALTHIIAVLFIFWLVITRPRTPLIPAFWWLAGFAAWEWISNYAGPYNGDGIEGGGIGYHFLIILLPLCLTIINHQKLLTYIAIGALASAILIGLQVSIGLDAENSPFRIDWEGNAIVQRPTGFTSRCWEIQFIHSMIFLTVLSHFEWQKFKTWIIGFTLAIGIILPLTRTIIAAFFIAVSIQLLFSDNNNDKIKKRLIAISLMALLLLGSLAILRPSFTSDLSTFGQRSAIFNASFEIFSLHPHTGIGGGEHFKNEFQDAWDRLSMNKSHIAYKIMGHTHNEALLLLSHHGWPALLLWLGFIVHTLLFVWKYGEHKDRILFVGLLVMHHIAGLSETYLDYSNTTYTIFLCYGLALHKPVRRYIQSTHVQL